MCRLMLVLLFVILEFIYAIVGQGCKISAISGAKDYKNDKFPSVARVTRNSNQNFICNAAIISKKQLVTAPSCLQEIRSEDILIHLKEFNQPANHTTVLEVSEIFIHPNWWSHKDDAETNVAIIITADKIPFDFFIFATCFREFISEKTRIHELSENESCQQVKRRRRKQNFSFSQIHFSERESGALYVQDGDEWTFFGFFSSAIKESGMCAQKAFPSFDDLYKYFRCSNRSVSTGSGTKAKDAYCSGDIMLEDNFDTLDTSTWKHENTLSGGGHWQFQWYVDDAENSFAKDGILHIKPTLTSAKFGEDFLEKGRINIPQEECTLSLDYGCSRDGQYGLLNPIRSASIRTVNSFAFKYGTVEVRAKVSAGDWLASTISLIPKENVYGKTWPVSGQIDLAEVRGNRKFFNWDEAAEKPEENIGVEQVVSALHFGPDASETRWERVHSKTNNSAGYDSNFHKFKLIWTPESISFYIDDVEVQHVKSYHDLWKDFKFDSSRFSNPWTKGTKLAPFDQEFYISIDLKVGGMVMFPDKAKNLPHKKPWLNSSHRAYHEFWDARKKWLKTWKDDDVDFQIDYVRIYAL